MTNFLLTKEEQDEMLEMFKQFDKNGDGQLSKQEIIEGYQKFFGKSLSVEEADEIMNELDKNKSGYIDYSGIYLCSQ
jgi:calcium-dependent protein kinase